MFIGDNSNMVYLTYRTITCVLRLHYMYFHDASRLSCSICHIGVGFGDVCASRGSSESFFLTKMLS